MLWTGTCENLTYLPGDQFFLNLRSIHFWLDSDFIAVTPSKPPCSILAALPKLTGKAAALCFQSLRCDYNWVLAWTIHTESDVMSLALLLGEGMEDGEGATLKDSAHWQSTANPIATILHAGAVVVVSVVVSRHYMHCYNNLQRISWDMPLHLLITWLLKSIYSTDYLLNINLEYSLLN